MTTPDLLLALAIGILGAWIFGTLYVKALGIKPRYTHMEEMK